MNNEFVACRTDSSMCPKLLAKEAVAVNFGLKSFLCVGVVVSHPENVAI